MFSMAIRQAVGYPYRTVAQTLAQLEQDRHPEATQCVLTVGPLRRDRPQRGQTSWTSLKIKGQQRAHQPADLTRVIGHAIMDLGRWFHPNMRG
jgi:hypothetical protein